jgi:hypothetical protein
MTVLAREPITLAAIRSTRLPISVAARREKVSSMMRRGSMPFVTKYATRCARVFVFPEPAPAMIKSAQTVLQKRKAPQVPRGAKETIMQWSGSCGIAAKSRRKSVVGYHTLHINFC